MKSKWLLVLTSILLVFCSNTHALELDLPNSVTFFEEEKTIVFEVENDSGERQDLRIKVFSPVAYEINGNKSFLENGEKAFVELAFIPNERVLNSVYESTVLVELGREIKQEKISLYFEKKIEYNEEESEEKDGEENLDGTNVFGSLTGNVFLAGFTDFFSPVNLFLTFIAAILMLLFISRLTKRLNTEGKK